MKISGDNFQDIEVSCMGDIESVIMEKTGLPMGTPMRSFFFLNGDEVTIQCVQGDDWKTVAIVHDTSGDVLEEMCRRGIAVLNNKLSICDGESHDLR